MFVLILPSHARACLLRCFSLLQYRPSSAHNSTHWTTNSGAPVWNNNNSLTGAQQRCMHGEAGGEVFSVQPPPPSVRRVLEEGDAAARSLANGSSNLAS